MMQRNADSLLHFGWADLDPFNPSGAIGGEIKDWTTDPLDKLVENNPLNINTWKDAQTSTKQFLATLDPSNPANYPAECTEENRKQIQEDARKAQIAMQAAGVVTGVVGALTGGVGAVIGGAVIGAAAAVSSLSQKGRTRAMEIACEEFKRRVMQELQRKNEQEALSKSNEYRRKNKKLIGGLYIFLLLLLIITITLLYLKNKKSNKK